MVPQNHPKYLLEVAFLFTFDFFLPFHKRQSCKSQRRREISHIPLLSRLFPQSAENCHTYLCPYLTLQSFFTLLCRRCQGFETGLPAGVVGHKHAVKEYKHQLIKCIVKTICFLLGLSHLKALKQDRFHFWGQTAIFTRELLTLLASVILKFRSAAEKGFILK